MRVLWNGEVQAVAVAAKFDKLRCFGWEAVCTLL